jgi:hypothetical protein
MRHRKRLAAITAAALCTGIGAAGGIASGGAASTSSKTTTTPPARVFDGGRGAVHSESVVLNRAGTAYETIVSDDGTLTAVSGSTLTIKEGTSSVTYKTVTVTVPSGATIVRNGKTAALTDLKAGDHVRVSVADDGATVMAGDASFQPDGHGPHGGFGGPGGPPPASSSSSGSSTS